MNDKIKEKIEDIKNAIEKQLNAVKNGNDYAEADWDVSISIMFDELSTLLQESNKEAVREAYKVLIREFNDAELEGKGYDFYFSIRTKIDGSEKQYLESVKSDEVSHSVTKECNITDKVDTPVAFIEVTPLEEQVDRIKKEGVLGFAKWLSEEGVATDINRDLFYSDIEGLAQTYLSSIGKDGE